MKCDFCGWATKANLRCSDGRIIMKDAFKHNDGETVPLVWNHQHNDPNEVLGHALLENREEGVYAYCSFNDTESGRTAKLLVQHGDVKALSIYANQLKQNMSNVLHGNIREVSLVLAGANPGAFIESILAHGEESDEEAIIYTGEDITLSHSEEEATESETQEPVEEETQEPVEETQESVEETPVESEPASEEETISHADNSDNSKKEEAEVAEKETKTEVEKKTEDKTVADVLETFNEEQKTVLYALIAEALESAEADADEEDETTEDNKGGNKTMKHNVFDKEEQVQGGVLSHADQAEIIKMAQTAGVGSLKSAMEIYASQHSDTMAHAVTEGDITMLFPDYKDVHAGAPELLERDHDWVANVMTKAHKSPVSRVRTKHVDARAQELRAKGYKKGSEKALSAAMKVLKRETNPQTVIHRDNLHRDDVLDITDFDVVAYQRNILKRALEEEVALAALIGDGRDDGAADKINEENIRPIWKDDDLYTIKAPVDVAAMTTKLQGTNTAANFGEDFIFTEAVIAATLNARVQFKGKGAVDFYCAPATLNKMLLARDMNGRRIYDTAADVAKALNVAHIYDIEQFADAGIREDADGNQFNLLGLFVNMANYQFGCTKGGEITSFEDFDIDFNQYKYLMETRLSGALTEAFSAIALEAPVAAG